MFRRPALAALCCGVLLGLAACAGRQPAAPLPVPSVTPTPAIDTPTAASVPQYDEWYAELERQAVAYREGLELVAAGEEVQGETVLGQAADAMLSRAEQCTLAPGCEMDPFLDAFARLLQEHSIALKRQSARVAELETSIAEQETEREPGTLSLVADGVGELPELLSSNGTPAERAPAMSLFRGTDLRELIELNAPVKAALDDWLTWMRPHLMKAHENYQLLRDRIAPIYEQAGLPEALLFGMISTESGGKVHSYSRAGAAGLLQFMRRTGHRYGLYSVDGFDQRLDPVAATRANVEYLNELLEMFSGNLEKALAAYNAGEARIRGIQRRVGEVSFWDRRMFWSLPRETREYVPRIFAAALLFLHPERFNLEWPSWAVQSATLTLTDDIALGELSICLGQQGNRDGWFRTLRNLNPQLKPNERVEAGTVITIPSSLVEVYERNCHNGELLERAQELHEANYPDGSEMIPYVVRRGDTLGRIASRHRCVSVRELAAINNVRPPRYVIHVGQRLKVPNCG